MISAHDAAVAYLTRSEDALWEWSAAGAVVIWADGRTTIVFREELREILQPFATTGLPSLNAVLMLLAACRDNWTEERDRRLSTTVMRMYGIALLPEELDGIAALPRDVRATTPGKRAIAAIALETAPRVTSPAVAAEVLDLLGHPLYEQVVIGSGPAVTAREMVRELTPLRDGVARISAETVRLRLRTGLDTFVEPDETTPSIAELLSRLERDPELGGIARLARNLMAVVHLPRPLADPDHLPLGGISDISNRGTLDRLLLSELAHDDDTLLTRIALNEAMYIRREAPPRSPPLTRALLLDAGLRMWGLPRVFATATALSLAAVGERQLDVRAWRASAFEAVPVDLRSREGLIAHLAALETTVHPGAALRDFLRQVTQSNDAVEPVLIVTDETLTDTEFQRLLAESAPPLVYIAAVNRRGRLQLLVRPPRGTRLVREAELDLDRLLAPPETPVPSVPLVDSKHNPDLPAIFSLPEFPLLLYAPVDYDRAWYVEGCGVFTVTHDRRLLHWEKPGQGGRQIAENIPAGKRIWHTHRPQDGIARAILYRQGSGTATIIQFDVARRACRIAQLALIQPTIKDVCPHAGVLLVISRSKADAFDPATGNRLATCDTAPERVWLGGRFFRHQQEVEVLGYDGKHLVWTVTDLYPFVISHLFEREGIDGPITLSLDGRITDIETERTLAQVEASHWTASALSPDGRRLVIQRTSAQQGPRRLVVDLNGGQVSPVPDSLHLQQVLQPEIDQYIRRGSALRHRFMHIGCRDSETLILLTRRGTRLPIAFPTGRGSLPFLPGDVGAPISALRTFRRIPGAPYRLRVAQWSDGSAAFLDARGLLHLKSSAPSAPEVTIVLAHPRAAWSPSRPYATGDSSYIRRGTRKDRQHFAEAMQEFIRRIR